MNLIQSISTEFLGSSLDKIKKQVDTIMLTNLDKFVVVYLYRENEKIMLFNNLRSLINYNVDNVIQKPTMFDSMNEFEEYINNYEIV